MKTNLVKAAVAFAVIAFLPSKAFSYGWYGGINIMKTELETDVDTIASDNVNDYPDGLGSTPWSGGEDEKWKFKTDDDLSWSLAVGYDLMRSPFRVEFEYYSYESKFKKGSFKVDGYTGYDLTFDGEKEKLTSYMFNGYLEVPFKRVDPYIGIGLGYANTEMDLGPVTVKTDNSIAWQWMLGVEGRITPTSEFIVGLEYRNFTMKDAEDKEDSATKFDTDYSTFLLKFRWDPFNP